MQGQSRVAFANSLRGLAALAVVASHYLGVFWTRPDAVGNLINAPVMVLAPHAIPAYVGWLNAVPLFNWGSYGVALFFLISGFVIPFSLRGASAAGFCLSRCLRIGPTYAIGFSLCLLAIAICSAYFGTDWPFSLREILIHYIPGIRDVLLSRGIDGIIWTLEIEMKFYLVCAVFIAWFRCGSLKVFAIPAALFVFTLWLSHAGLTRLNQAPVPYRVAVALIFALPHIIFMFIGVVFHSLYTGRIGARNAGLFVLALFGGFCLEWATGPHAASAFLTLSYGVAVATFAFAYACPRYFKSNPTLDFLADISYPLYVIHGVAGYAALRLLLDRGVQPSAALLLVTASSLSAAWLLHRLVEMPSQRLGKRLAARLDASRTASHLRPQPLGENVAL